MTVVVFYFNAYDAGGEEWASLPAQMVDGGTGSRAATNTDGDVQLLTASTCTGDNLGYITKVELRYYGETAVVSDEAILRPVFNGTNDGTDINIECPDDGYTAWYDITTDTNAPSKWDWNDVKNLDCDVEYNQIGGVATTVNIGIVEIQVTYIEHVGDLDIHYSGSWFARGWCTRYDQDNHDLVIETFIKDELIQDIVDNTVPKAVGEWHIATRGYKYYDSTWKGKNTLHLSSNNSTGSNLRYMRNDVDIFPENITAVPAVGASGWVNLKIEGKISGNLFTG